MEKTYYRYYTSIVASEQSGISWLDSELDKRYFIIEKVGNKFYCYSKEKSFKEKIIRPYKQVINNYIYENCSGDLEEITEAEAFIDLL